MSKSNLQIDEESQPEIRRVRRTEAEIDEPEVYTSSVSSFDDNFNCDEMFIVTIDEPHVANSNSALINSNDMNSNENNQLAANRPRSISRVMDEQIRQTMKAVRFSFSFFSFLKR